jgi:hypothetical protein
VIGEVSFRRHAAEAISSASSSSASARARGVLARPAPLEIWSITFQREKSEAARSVVKAARGGGVSLFGRDGLDRRGVDDAMTLAGGR